MKGLRWRRGNTINSSIRVFLFCFSLHFLLFVENEHSCLCFRKPVLVRSSPLPSNGFSSSLQQTPHCGNLDISFATKYTTHLVKKATIELIYNDTISDRVTQWLASFIEEVVNQDDSTDAMVTIGSSHGWEATLKDGIVRLQDDLNPVASDTDPKRIFLPPLVTLPHCQTQIVTNVAMSSTSPEDDDCLVAVKFLGPQLSFCRPAQGNSEWINIRIADTCFFSSRVIYSKKDDMFCIPGSGGHLFGSWDLDTHKHVPKLQTLRYQNLPKLTKTKRELLHSCSTSEHLVESRFTGETFMVKWYKKIAKIINGTAKMMTEALMVFKLDEEGNAVYTQDMGDLCIFLSSSEPFCVPASFVPGLPSNSVFIFDVNEIALVNMTDSSIENKIENLGPLLHSISKY